MPRGWAGGASHMKSTLVVGANKLQLCVNAAESLGTIHVRARRILSTLLHIE